MGNYDDLAVNRTLPLAVSLRSSLFLFCFGEEVGARGSRERNVNPDLLGSPGGVTDFHSTHCREPSGSPTIHPTAFLAFGVLRFSRWSSFRLFSELNYAHLLTESVWRVYAVLRYSPHRCQRNLATAGTYIFMCGIAGIFAYRASAAPADREELLRPIGLSAPP